MVKDMLPNYKADTGSFRKLSLVRCLGQWLKKFGGVVNDDNWVSCDAVGSSGGILVLWNKKTFIKKDCCIGKFSVSVLLEEIRSNSTWTVTSVYGPNDRSLRDCF